MKQEYITELGPKELGYEGLLRIISFRDETGRIVHKYLGQDWGYPGASGDIDVNFLETGCEPDLAKAHLKTVSLHTEFYRSN